MTTSNENGTRARKTDAGNRQAWTKPTLRRMKAGSAEVGTRATNDGAFTTS